jgi:response regulator RpfG family c-di-GMP phosphodiesterase
LRKLINKQNISLKELNQNLANKVKLLTKQIHIALNRIERNNNATQKVLYNLTNINPNINSGFANSVSQLSKRIAEHLSLSKDEVSDITYAGLLCKIGLLGLDTAIYSKPFSELNYNHMQEYLSQTKIAQLALGPALHLQAVSDIISYQFKCYNGEGPSKLVDPQIPIGAKILSVARDYWRYALGRITSVNMNETQVKAEMKKFTGKRYDPAVLEILFNTDDIISYEFIEKQIPTDALEPGMVLKYNLFNNAHILVLPEGHVFCKATITKIVQFDKSQPKPMTLIVEEQ